MPDINERFHNLHEQTYTFRLDTPVELVNYHVIAFGRVQKAQIKKVDGGQGNLEQARKATRRVNYDELGFHESAIYERDLLPIGLAIPGPLVVEEPASTTVVFPDQQLIKDEYGFLHIEMIAAQSDS
jgi:N-methylhydantoinase A